MATKVSTTTVGYMQRKLPYLTCFCYRYWDPAFIALREICLHDKTEEEEYVSFNQEIHMEAMRELQTDCLEIGCCPVWGSLCIITSSPSRCLHTVGFFIGNCGPFGTSCNHSVCVCVWVYGSSRGPVLAAPPPVCTASCFYCCWVNLWTADVNCSIFTVPRFPVTYYHQRDTENSHPRELGKEILRSV